MSEDPMAIAREAKSIHQSLKEFLKTKEPFDRDVELQRKNLRKQYLNLLLLHPYAKESKDAETHLWMQTSYAFISSYKQRVSIIDRAVQGNARQPENPRQQQNQRQNVHGPVEYRKLLQRFRQFLAEEEKFWIQLVLRMHRSFGLREVATALETLGLITETTGNGTTTEAPIIGNALFPSEPSSSLAPNTRAEKDSRLSIMSKALICLGDLARYRELYNESGGRPRAGHEAGVPARRGKIRKKGTSGIDAIPLARNYDRAQHRYEQARLLVPTEGNASHQLAIVASYLPDTLVSLTHYYRALCVKHPYEPASENMAIHMTKALQLWGRNKQEREQVLASAPSIINQVDILKNRVVVLHALWRKNMDKDVKEQERHIYEEFHRLVAERNLPCETICNVIVLSQGALWKHRMIRDGNSGPGQARHENARSPEANIILEWRIFQHLLDVHIALLEVGTSELKELPSLENVDNDLAQRITATFRRTLPALRIASKWLRGNLGYMIQDPEFQAYQQKEKSKGGNAPQKTPGKISGHSSRTVRFWIRYTKFMTALARAFPENQLVPLTHPLEEDIDMRGFLPLKKAMDEVYAKDDRTTPERAHPNDEQLMRIFDLLTDAKVMVDMQNSPIEYDKGTFKIRSSVLEPRPGRHHARGTSFKDPSVIIPEQAMMDVIRDSTVDALLREEDALTEGTSRTDEDILNDAFKHVGSLDMEEDEDDDEIVWNPKATSPTLSPRFQATPITPQMSRSSSLGNSKAFPSPSYTSLSPMPQANLKTPVGSPRTATIPALTAQDLLLDVMNAGRRPSALVSTLDTPGMQPTLLFGSDLTHQHSIWSASHDEQLLKFGAAAPNQPGTQTSPRTYSHSLNPSQDLNSSSSIWANQPINGGAAPGSIQLSLSGSMQQHQNAYAPAVSSQTQNGGGAAGNMQQNLHHHRIPSSSNAFASNSSPYYGNLNLNLNNPSMHASSPMLQQQQQAFLPPLPNSHLHLGPQPLLFQQQQMHQGHEGQNLNQTYYDSAVVTPQGRYQPQHPSSLQDASRTNSHLMSSPLWGNIG